MVAGHRFEWHLATPVGSTDTIELFNRLKSRQGNATFQNELIDPVINAVTEVTVTADEKFDNGLVLPQLSEIIWNSSHGNSQNNRDWFERGYVSALANWDTDSEGAANKICSRLEFLIAELCQRHDPCPSCRRRKMGQDAPARLKTLATCEYKNGFQPSILFDYVQKLLGVKYSTSSGRSALGETDLRTRLFHGYPEDPTAEETAQVLLALQLMLHIDFKPL